MFFDDDICLCGNADLCPLIRIPYWHLKELSLNDLLLDSTSFLVN